MRVISDVQFDWLDEQQHKHDAAIFTALDKVRTAGFLGCPTLSLHLTWYRMTRL